MTRQSLRVLSRMMIEGMSGRMNRSVSSSACLVMQISYENIKDVLHVPIVEGIHKVNNDYYVEGLGAPYFTSSVAVLDVIGFDLPFAIGDGSVLAVDVCDSWYAFTKKQ